MARITPKTNWVAHNIPVATDFNRIEGNNQQAFDEIDDLSDEIDLITDSAYAFTGTKTFSGGIAADTVTATTVNAGGVVISGGAVYGTVWSA